MRIISGKHRGRKLLDCREFKDLRPTSDKNRENLFNVLLSSRKIQEIDFDISNCDLLDVFSGSGAVALEALSRGIKSAALIDKNRDHLDLAKQNAELFGKNDLEYHCFDLSRSSFQSQRKFNLIFIDPPYNKNLALISLKNLAETGWVENGALIIIEHFFAEKLSDAPENVRLIESRKYKDTIFSFFVFEGSQLPK
ncbi:MAG: 16S rRNA (guanine966-N2)-methyltransferase [Rickettsiales bacterium]|jgi:16S rRNA (guanine966-N2)-methyltransferase